MQAWYPQIGLVLGIVVLGMACSPAGGPAATAPSAPSATGAAAPKQITIALTGQPPSFVARMNGTANVPPGAYALEGLVNSALGEIGADHSVQPLLATALPSLANGQWVLNPDGTMQTTWRIRDGATWQDGTPFTADDLVFTTTFDLDKDLPIRQPGGYSSVQRVEAVDPQTVRVTWSQLYNEADMMFTEMWASPLPRHLLGNQYATDKQGLNSSSYWGTNYVGTGPFAVRQLVPGTEIQLVANDRYVLGRPKIDRIVIHFIPDMNTLITNFAAGTVDLVLGRGLTPQLATQLKGQRPDVKFRQELSGSLVAFPQFMNPNPPIIAQTPFRQALMYGLDRKQLVESLTDGIGSVADSYIGPDWAQQAAVANSIVKYPYDRNRADQMLQGLGYIKGNDGMYRDSSGQPLAIEVRSHGSPIGEQTTTAVAALWTGVGVASTPVIVNEAQMNDRQYLAIFPGISVAMAQTPPNAVLRWRSSLAPVEENHYSGTNYSRYQDPAFDALITRFSTAIAPEDQDAALRQIVQELTANLRIMPLFYNPSITAMSNAMENVGAAQGVWDVHLWDVVSPRA